MSVSTSAFAEFTREWGVLLAQDSSASLDHLFSSYKNYAKTTGVTRSRSCSSDSGSSTSPCSSPFSTIKDFTEIWAASKRVNMEWEAACMVRGIRSSIDGFVTQQQLMLSMLCWAATLQHRQQKFFKECFTRVRQIIHQAALRCTSCAEGESTESIYEEAAFCVALQLFGWHNSLLICLERIMALLLPLHTEEDVLLFTQKVAQELSSACSPQRNSTDSSPAITTTRTSDLSTSSEQELPVHTSAVATKKDEPTASLAVASASGEGDVAGTSLRRPRPKEHARSALRDHAKRTSALIHRFSTITTAPFNSPVSENAGNHKRRQTSHVTPANGVPGGLTLTRSLTVVTSHRVSPSSALLPLSPPSSSKHPSSIIRIPPPKSLTGVPQALTAVSSQSSPLIIAADSSYKRLGSAMPDVCRPAPRQQAPRHRVSACSTSQALEQANTLQAEDE
ncbi:hypothetical protein JKF63_06201 [Porcisia hertigi]|uniref:Uncharacterized protein n=1 Tax=Porcisia hertigi TaxID=2761500 RepID=A0A836LEQ6_9TRYP|nr:hypothetical protein JKF63_06201 [Porcisia hertigi]